ncbi:multidrug effflux MFS transporter [Vannielia litorea]|uniref:Bcr/CflA family efflux transporter n=1 Tax=Vannielia litorea TaxID=1217970 RepID=A0A1N6F2P3_9RHOB|nr:multidrug effflux MFS transporter [Vannielia litorea]SIN89499.1 MFS transporter, DHA1 family, bicyclomycin/chloramphenicol resistance protein [Vannielia litorea]
MPQAKGLFRSALVLGLMSMVGPFAIDMYLPVMPEIGAALGADEAAMGATIIGYFIAFGLAQLVYGPWADQAGRRVPIYVGLGIFALGSVGAAMAESLGTLVAWRFVQGLGGAAVMVVPRAIIRDLHTGAEATRMMAMIMLVISVSPMLAPLAGSGVSAVAGWRAIFWVLAVAAVACVSLMHFALPETLPPERRVRVNVAALSRVARMLLRDPKFMGLTFVGGLGMASFFIFLALAPFVYTQDFGLTPTQFSLAFAVNAAGFFAASQAAGPLADRLGLTRVVLGGATGFGIATATLLAVVASGAGSLAVVMTGLFIGNAFLGLVIPTTMVMALDDHGENAGMASSLGGTLQMVAGGVAVSLASPFHDGTAMPMVAAIAACGLGATLLAWVILGRLRQPA